MDVRKLLTLCMMSSVLMGCSTFREHSVTQGEWFRAQEKVSWQFQRVAILGLEKDPLFQQSLTIAYLNKGIDVVEREKIDEILREGTVVKDWADLSDQEKAKALGRLLKVDALVLAGVMHESYGALTKQQVKMFGGFLYGANVGSAVLSPFPKANVIAEYGATWRIIDVASGEIACVGSRIISIRQKADAKNLNSLSALELIRLLCNEIVDDSRVPQSGVRDRIVAF